MLAHRNSAAIDAVCPVNWLHPLNRGLVSWHLCVPGWMGGSRWQDLCGRFPGTLTNMDPPTDWVGPQGRLGGFGCLDFDGTNDEVVAGRAVVLTSSILTIAFWCLTDATTAFLRVVSLGDGTHGCFVGPSAGIIQTGHSQYDTIGKNWGSSVVGAWHHVVAVFDAVNSTTAVWINGVPQTSSNQSGLTTNSNSETRFGRRATGTAFFDGRLDDVRIYSRAVSAWDATER